MHTLLALQTYEGGLGGEPGNEAHGGYTFCGLAALALVGQATRLDLTRYVMRGGASLAGWDSAGQGRAVSLQCGVKLWRAPAVVCGYGAVY